MEHKPDLKLRTCFLILINVLHSSAWCQLFIFIHLSDLQCSAVQYIIVNINDKIFLLQLLLPAELPGDSCEEGGLVSFLPLTPPSPANFTGNSSFKIWSLYHFFKETVCFRWNII